MAYVRACLVAQSCLTFKTLWPVTRQAPLSMGFSRQERSSGLPFPPPGDLPDPETEPTSVLHLWNWQVDSLPLSHPGSPIIGCGHTQIVETQLTLASVCETSYETEACAND